MSRYDYDDRIEHPLRLVVIGLFLSALMWAGIIVAGTLLVKWVWNW